MAKLEGITVEINGNATGLNNALKDVNKELSNSQKELNQVNKLLKLDPKNTELLAQKQQLLTSSIQATSDKLKTLKLAKEQADKVDNVDKNSQAYRELQREIADTELKMKSLNKQMSNFGSVSAQQVKNFGASMQKVGASVESVGKKMTMLSAAIAGAFTKSVLDTTSFADEILTLSTQTGIAAEQLQVLKKAEELVDVPLETVTSSYAKLTKNMATASKGTGDAAKAFKKLGISIIDSNGELRNNNDVFNETIRALANISNETERDAMAMQIFGKSAQALNPLIEGGIDTIDELSKSLKENGQIMSEDQLKAAGELDDKIQELKNSFGAVALNLGTALIPIFEKVTDLLTKLSNKFNTLDEGTQQIIVSVGLVVAALGPVVLIVGKIITSVGTIMTMWPTIMAGMTAISTFITGTLIPALSSLFSLLIANPIGLIVAAIAAVIAAIVLLYNNCEWFRDAVNGIIKGMVDFVAKSIEVIVEFFTVTIPNAFNAVIDFIKNNWQEILLFITNPIAGALKLLYNLNPKFKEWVDDCVQKIKDAFGKMVDVGKYIVEGLWQGILNTKDWLLGKIKEFAKTITQGIKDFFGIESPSKVMRDQVGKYLAQGIGVGFEKELPNTIDDMTKSLDSITDDLQSSINMAMPEINRPITAQNYYTTKNYQATTEIVRQPQAVTIEISKQKLAEVMIPALDKQKTILGGTLA